MYAELKPDEGLLHHKRRRGPCLEAGGPSGLLLSLEMLPNHVQSAGFRPRYLSMSTEQSRTHGCGMRIVLLDVFEW